MGKIDFTRFSKLSIAIVPIVGYVGKYGGRKFIHTTDDGWYKVFLGDIVEVERKATLLEIERELEKHKTLSGYAYGDEVVPVNFQNLFARGLGETVKVWFLDQEPWTAVKFVQWEDGRFYYVDMDFTYHSLLSDLQDDFEAGQTVLDHKGAGPELRYYWLLLSLERNTWQHLQELEGLRLSKTEREKRLQEFQLNFSERIERAVTEAGGRFISATRQASNKYLVIWKSGRQIVKTILNERLRVENAGYCLSGFDKRYNISGIVALASEFQKDTPLYITRT